MDHFHCELDSRRNIHSNATHVIPPWIMAVVMLFPAAFVITEPLESIKPPTKVGMHRYNTETRYMNIQFYYYNYYFRNS